jgi:hypothetical protein
MTVRVDLLTPAQDALVAALKGASFAAGVQVFQNVPEGTEPPYVLVGRLTSDNQEQSGDQFELITAEVIHVYRGNQRRALLAMLHAARAAIDNQVLVATGAAFTRPRLDKAEAGEAMPDGVTYVGIQTFEFYAEPA